MDFFCSVFSFSAFMHALTSSACPISPLSLISCFASGLGFFLLVSQLLWWDTFCNFLLPLAAKLHFETCFSAQDRC